MNWARKQLLEYGRELSKSAIIAGGCSLLFLTWSYLGGNHFVWHQVDLLEQPSFFERAFYSTFTFISLGLLLYLLKFYRSLYIICVKVLGSRELYRAIKGIVWIVLMGTMYFYIIPSIVKIVNLAISLFYNLASFILYLSPALGLFIFGFGFLSWGLIYAKKKATHMPQKVAR